MRDRMFVIAGVVMIMAMVISTKAVAGPPVKFQVPKRWTNLHEETSDSTFKNLYLVKAFLHDKKEYYANALIAGWKVPDAIGFSYVDQMIQHNVSDSGWIVVGIQDGPFWKTYLTETSIGGALYIGLFRAGIKNGWFAELFVAFPVVPGGALDSLKTRILTIDTLANWQEEYRGIGVDSGTVDKYINDFNETCKTLRIDHLDEFKTSLIVSPLPRGYDQRWLTRRKE